MDIAAMLREQVSKLPEGDHTPGLRAVVRHIDAAIGHFERAIETQDDDAFTDSIYRTNQAYEGSLKEAFRAISKEDPTKKTLFEIENYLQTQALRARVLEQMKRYREDYRNPSTHDYKLDFDENEALLAILSVTAFAKLLADQIGEKIQIEIAKTEVSASKSDLKIGGSDWRTYLEKLSTDIQRFLNSSEQIGKDSRENTSLIAAYLSNSGVPFSTSFESHGEGYWILWDIAILDEVQNPVIGIDLKASRGRQSETITAERIGNTAYYLAESGLSFGILVEGVPMWDSYDLSTHEFDNGRVVMRLGRNWSG